MKPSATVLFLGLVLGWSAEAAAQKSGVVADISPAPTLTSPSAIGFASSLLGKPADWGGNAADLFAANYEFPSSFASMETQPWMTLDPRKPEEVDNYYRAVLRYALSSFQGDISANCPKVSKDWYHMPWMTFSFGNRIANIEKGSIGSGREPICGLTQERPAPKKFLYGGLDKKVQTWAVGMFNAPGGYLLGRIWRSRGEVNLTETKFPNGSFVAKFLFTEATDEEVPFLQGAPIWEANIYASVDTATIRKTKPMRLMQIDFGVKDKRVKEQTGWVYGTFLYYKEKDAPTSAWTDNLIPVGLMWGKTLRTGIISMPASGKLTRSPATLIADIYIRCVRNTSTILQIVGQLYDPRHPATELVSARRRDPFGIWALINFEKWRFS